MSDTNTADKLDDVPRPPAIPTRDQYEGCRVALCNNVEALHADPLLQIGEETQSQIVAMAYHDVLMFDNLQRAVQDKIRETKEIGCEAAAKRFNLRVYKQKARQLADGIQAYHERVRKINERNWSVLKGGKADPNTEVLADGTSLTIEAMVTGKSMPRKCLGQLMLRKPGRIWFDDFHGNYFTDWAGGDSDDLIPETAITDQHILAIYFWMHSLHDSMSNAGYDTVKRAVHQFGARDHRNGPRNWLQSLQWDGVPRLEDMLSYAYGTPNDIYHRAVGRCWFVSMVARMMRPGCKVDTMPVLVGKQGTFKSTSLEIIGGKWYRAINTSVSKAEDFKMSLLGVLVGEIAELDAISGMRVENSRVKALLSTSEDVFRPPYAATPAAFLRTVVFVGTTNDSDWHKDDTGGRRFWPIVCADKIDLEWLKKFRDQLFAEAHDRYKRGERWHDVPTAEQEAMIADHYGADPWEAQIEAAIETWTIYDGVSGVKPIAGDPSANADPSQQHDVKHWGTVLTTNRVATEALKLPIERQTRVTSNRIARCLRKLGWSQMSIRAAAGRSAPVIRGWICNASSALKKSEKDETLNLI